MNYKIAILTVVLILSITNMSAHYINQKSSIKANQLNTEPMNMHSMMSFSPQLQNMMKTHHKGMGEQEMKTMYEQCHKQMGRIMSANNLSHMKDMMQ